MTRPSRDIDGCRAAHARLEAEIARLNDAEGEQPSRLPGWSVGHVLTHLARNADSVTRRLEAAARDEVVDQYPGGYEGRSAEIDEGAARSAVVLIADVGTANARLDAAIDAMPDDAWARVTRAVGGREQPAAAMIFHRWREVEVHHVDLGLGYEPSQWPAELVETWLPSVLETVPARTDRAQLLAWAIGRGEVPELRPWG